LIIGVVVSVVLDVVAVSVVQVVLPLAVSIYIRELDEDVLEFVVVSV
jgi:hypothetical protein